MTEEHFVSLEVISAEIYRAMTEELVIGISFDIITNVSKYRIFNNFDLDTYSKRTFLKYFQDLSKNQVIVKKVEFKPIKDKLVYFVDYNCNSLCFHQIIKDAFIKFKTDWLNYIEQLERKFES